MKQFLVIAALLFFTSTFAQDTTAVVVHKDRRVDLLIERQSAINAAVKKANTRTMKGYRLMVINTNKRDEAIEAKTTIYKNFPSMKAYLSYQSPFYKLKAGNFRTREEAVRYQQMMNRYFPKGVFIIGDIIEINPEEETEITD